MKLSGGTRGYTIVEVMIFLVVSAGLLVSVLGVISGQQQKTRFQTGVRDFESQLQDTINDVETGYYPNTAGNAGEGGDLKAGDKIFIGKGIQFYKNSSTNELTSWREMVISGNTTIPDPPGEPKDVTTLSEATPTASGSSVSHELLNGVVLTSIKYGTAGTSSFGIAVVSGISSDGKKSSGSRGQLAYLDISSVDNEGFLDSAIGSLTDASIANASNGVVFCLSEGGGGRVAAVALGLAPQGAGIVSTGQKNISTVYFDDEAKNNFGCTS
ncbi:hypothetical protein A3F37_04050 [Candidatus Saccharibacteria bacterium RIFCSPHIGHO2_12_FULL_41_12]|nr:MAG: hypothetical protein A3F37_04050 [Candidatus Saccharibacteria bacterium RIFCSPHIGHO2_12_FULL_41_12]